MSIFFSHTTALEYWRKYRMGIAEEPKATRLNPPLTPPNTKSLKADMTLGFSRPLHIVVSDANARKVSKVIVSHCSCARFAQGSFFRIDKQHFVSSPELCFFQMASMLSFEEHAKLAYELCGGYVLNPESERGFESCEPLTTVAKLFAYTKKMAGSHGNKRTLEVLKYVENSANSPMETILTLMLILPKKMGGFALPAPKLNARFIPNRFMRGTADKKCYYCDLYWSDARLVLEYDSNAYHTGASRIAADSARRNALAMLGIKVISVTSDQLRNVRETKKIVLLVGKYLGKKIHFIEPGFTSKNLELRKRLLP